MGHPLKRLWRKVARRYRERAWLREEQRLRARLVLPADASLGPAWSVLHEADPGGLCTKLSAALREASEPDAKAPAGVRDIQGMSGQRYRLLVNRLLAQLPGARYLEVGSWLGSTACAALHGNAVHGLCIDNWSKFGAPKAGFLRNMETHCGPPASWEHREADFRAIDYRTLGLFDVYLFDGPHGLEDQYDGVVRAQPALATSHVLVVDDWNWPEVRTGTLRALCDLGARIEACTEIRTTLDGTHPIIEARTSDWHNGYWIGVVTKA